MIGNGLPRQRDLNVSWFSPCTMRCPPPLACSGCVAAVLLAIAVCCRTPGLSPDIRHLFQQVLENVAIGKDSTEPETSAGGFPQTEPCASPAQEEWTQQPSLALAARPGGTQQHWQMAFVGPLKCIDRNLNRRLLEVEAARANPPRGAKSRQPDRQNIHRLTWISSNFCHSAKFLDLGKQPPIAARDFSSGKWALQTVLACGKGGRLQQECRVLAKKKRGGRAVAVSAADWQLWDRSAGICGRANKKPQRATCVAR